MMREYWKAVAPFLIVLLVVAVLCAMWTFLKVPATRPEMSDTDFKLAVVFLLFWIAMKGK